MFFNSWFLQTFAAMIACKHYHIADNSNTSIYCINRNIAKLQDNTVLSAKRVSTRDNQIEMK